MRINTIYIFSEENKIQVKLTKDREQKDKEQEEDLWPYKLNIKTTTGDLTIFLSRQDFEELQFILTQSEEDIPNA